MNGEPRVPGWLADLGVKAGEYQCDSKLRWKRAMKSRCFSPAARVYACLGLHTMAFQQELAVKLEAGKRVLLTPTDIAAETGLRKQNVRPALLELENCGLAAVKGSTKGRVELYAWAVPREPQPVENGNSRHYHFGGATPELLSLLNRYKIRLPEGFVLSRDYLSAVETAARNYQNAEMVLKSALKGHGAPDRIYKEERNERDIERNISSSSTSPTASSPVEPPAPAKAEEEDPPSDYQTFKKLYPKDHFDEGKAKPAFQGYPKSYQRRVIKRLHVYLDCDRWKAEQGRWVPLASNWLKCCNSDPPPVIRNSRAPTIDWEENERIIAEARAAEAAAVAAGRLPRPRGVGK